MVAGLIASLSQECNQLLADPRVIGTDPVEVSGEPGFTQRCPCDVLQRPGGMVERHILVLSAVYDESRLLHRLEQILSYRMGQIVQRSMP